MLLVWWAERNVVCDVAGKLPPPLSKLPHPLSTSLALRDLVFFSFFFFFPNLYPPDLCVAYWHEKATVLLNLLQSIV